MLPLHSLSVQNNPPFSLQPFSLLNKPNTYISESLVPENGFSKKKTNTYSPSFSSSYCIVYAAKKDSQQFEIDPDKAREALRNLDQQLQSRSEKQVRSPKIKGPDVPDVSFSRDQIQAEKEEVQEFSGSFFAITATAAFAFTVFYNVLFYTVIKPAIDGQ